MTDSATEPSIVVIGYGSELRGDDAVGQHIAAAVAEWNIPNIRALAVHQLTPELAAVLASAQFAIFADASADPHQTEARIESLEYEGATTTVFHSATPQSLIALSQSVYDQSPQAWLVSVPTDTFEFGAELTPTAQHGMETALEHIKILISELLTAR